MQKKVAAEIGVLNCSSFNKARFYRAHNEHSGKLPDHLGAGWKPWKPEMVLRSADDLWEALKDID